MKKSSENVIYFAVTKNENEEDNNLGSLIFDNKSEITYSLYHEIKISNPKLKHVCLQDASLEHIAGYIQGVFLATPNEVILKNGIPWKYHKCFSKGYEPLDKELLSYFLSRPGLETYFPDLFLETLGIKFEDEDTYKKKNKEKYWGGFGELLLKKMRLIK